MKGYITNIEKETILNEDYRRALYTAKNSQLVLMNIRPGEEIGEETHKLDQFLRFERGNGKAVLDGVESDVGDGIAVVVPAGVKHNFINTGDIDLKLYTIYSPPNHIDKVIHKTKQQADADDEHFDGITTE